jgi:hypothetical protein
MTALRVVCALGALVLAGADLLLGRPDGFLLQALGALVLFVVGFGAIAADSIPWRTAPFLCSLVATALAPLALLRITSGWAVGLAALVLHVLGELSARGRLGPPPVEYASHGRPDPTG